MKLTHLMTAAAAIALTGGIAMAQTPSAANPASKSPAQAGASAPSTASATTPGAVAAKGDIIETAKAAGQFNTFVKAAEATNLTSVLKTNKNLTVFAPTDAAFAALPPGELDRLMADKAQLQKLLTHHVINARVDSTKIKGARGSVTTVAGDQVQLDGSGDALLAGSSTIVQADVMASNGIIHVVDKVLTPGAAAAGTTAAPASTTAADPAAQTAPTTSTAPSTADPAGQPKDDASAKTGTAPAARGN